MKSIIHTCILILMTGTFSYGQELSQVDKTEADFKEDQITIAPADNDAPEVNHYDAQLKKVNSIKDERLKELVKAELAKKIAQDITSTDSDTSVTETNLVVTGPKALNDKKFNYSIGLIAKTSAFEMGQDVNVIFYGSELNLSGVTTIRDSHKFRLGVSFVGLQSDSVQVDNISYSLDEYKYRGLGINASYTFILNSIVGIGPYSSYTFGSLEHCGDVICEEVESNLFDFGIRLDLVISSWNPFLAVGYTYAKYSENEFNGASVYLGLLNFEL